MPHPFDPSDFVGCAWQDRGRGPGYDCWGLLAAAFEAGTGVVLPSYAEDYVTAADRAETAQLLTDGLSDWSEVRPGQERAFDGVVMRVGGRAHVGLVVRAGHLLHMPRGKLSVIEPLHRFLAVLTGIYRHRALAGQ